MAQISYRRLFLYLIILCCLAMLPMLGLTDFNTKGEPREAVVAMSMLEQHNWILPTNNGGEIPYKPPMFHWCVAACSLLTGGMVNEFTSRLPSALSLIVLTALTFRFFARRRGEAEGLVAALLMFSSLEVWRAGANCRVDMMLTLFTVAAIYALVSWWERGMKFLPWLAILLMSCATLTKGPVGVIIPSLVAGVFMLLRRAPVLKTFLLLFLAALLSLILPLCWYWAAYQQGGDEFLYLVMEENFGRMLGNMSYDVHVHSWPYNIAMLLSGLLPWTLIPLLRICVLKKSSWRKGYESLRSGVGHWFEWLRKAPLSDVLSLTACVVIFIFYSLPKGKRGVYLLPMYPFAAYFLARLMLAMARNKRRILMLLGQLIAVVAAGVSIFFFVDALLLHKVAVQPVSLVSYLFALIGIVAAVAWWRRWRKEEGARLCVAMAVVAIAAYTTAWGSILPEAMKARSARPVAEDIVANFPDAPMNIYEFIADAEEAAGDPIHFFELNFYLGDKIRNFVKENPTSGYLLISDEDAEKWLPAFGEDGYKFEKVYTPDRKLMKRHAALYRFIRN